MTWKKAYRFILAGMLIALTVLLSAGTVRIWREGTARKAENPLEAIYTPEKVAEELGRIRPLAIAAAGMTAAGMLAGLRGGERTRQLPSAQAERRPLRTGKRGRLAADFTGRKPGRGPAAARIALLAAAAALIVLGALNGSLNDVLMKAINICTECIGLG